MTRTSYWLARTKTPVTCTLAPLAHWLFSQPALMWHNGLGAARGQRLRKEPCASFPTRFLFSRPTGRLTGPLILRPFPCIPYCAVQLHMLQMKDLPASRRPRGHRFGGFSRRSPPLYLSLLASPLAALLVALLLPFSAPYGALRAVPGSAGSPPP